jgi:hypothetical protein
MKKKVTKQQIAKNVEYFLQNILPQIGPEFRVTEAPTGRMWKISHARSPYIIDFYPGGSKACIWKNGRILSWKELQNEKVLEVCQQMKGHKV